MKIKLIKSILANLLFLIVLVVFIATVVKLQDCINYSYTNSINRATSEIRFSIGDTQVSLDTKKLGTEVVSYFKTLLSGSFGKTSDKKEVSQYIKAGLPRTLTLLVGAIIFSTAIGIVKGIFDSKRGKHKQSNFKLLSTVTFLSVPDVFVIIIIQSLVVWLYKHNIRIFPLAGADTWKHAVLPIMSLSLIPMAYIARITAMSFDKIYEQDYIKTALGKGASSTRIIWIHAFRNAIVDIVGSFSSITAILISSLLLIEYMFYYPGIAQSMYSLYERNSSNAVIGLAIILGMIYFIIDTLFKILKYILTPKLREAK